MIKLIATDLDGTLFYPKMRVRGTPPKNRKFLIRYLASGGKLVLVSGRNGSVISKMEKQLGHKVSLIGCNGAYYLENGKFEDFHPMNREKLLELYAFLHRDYGAWIWMLFDTTDYLYCNAANVPLWVDLGFRIGNRFNNFFAEAMVHDDVNFLHKITEQDNYKVMVCFGMQEDGKRKCEQILPVLKKHFGEYFEMATSNNVIEFTAKGVTKGVGLYEYCKKNGFDINEVAVCGDSGNDLTMFEHFPHSFAMAHAKEYFKSQANHIIESVSDLQEYLDHPELLEHDEIHEINYQKALEN